MISLTQITMLIPIVFILCRFGRRIIILCCLLQTALMGTGAAFAPSFSLYCFFRFMAGMGICGFIINDLGLSKSMEEDGILYLLYMVWHIALNIVVVKHYTIYGIWIYKRSEDLNYKERLTARNTFFIASAALGGLYIT